MKPSEILKPGMVGVNLKGFIDPMGTIDTVLQGDTEAAHVWMVLPSGKIATTGAEKFIIYGEVEPDKYLKGKTFFLLETVDPLTAGQHTIMQAAHNDLMRSGWGRIYGIWKFPILGLLGFIHGDVEKTGKQPKRTRPVCPICSQAVGYPCWTAGLYVGKSQGKLDYTALLPETFLKEAKQTSYMLAQGYLENRSKPCYMFRTVQDIPYRF